MDFNDQIPEQQPNEFNASGNGDDMYLREIAAVGENMVGWLKFLGIMSILGGILTAISIVGIIIAWLPIWMGILLFQAGSQITEARVSRNYQHLVEMMRKFKTYFIIQGILLIVSVVFSLIWILIFGAAILSGISQSYSY